MESWESLVLVSLKGKDLMWNQQVEVLHHHLTGPMGVSPHNTSYKSFAS